jgi:hypothetical protein
MPNAKDADLSPTKRILIAGNTGTGKTSQIWTLPGRKFAYIFDPNALSSLKGCDLDYEVFFPDIGMVDTGLKGFNKGSKSDSNRSKRAEPKVYNLWEDHINTHYEKGFFNDYQWLIFDSATFFSKAVMDRQLYINNRYGGTEEIADYKIVGAKFAEIMTPITTSHLNIFMTAHLSVYQDEKTSKVTTQLFLPGRARNLMPLQFTDVLQALTIEDEKKGVRYVIRTRPDPRGLQDIRTSIPGLETIEDVTIEDFKHPERYGLGALLSRERK